MERKIEQTHELEKDLYEKLEETTKIMTDMHKKMNTVIKNIETSKFVRHKVIFLIMSFVVIYLLNKNCISGLGDSSF